MDKFSSISAIKDAIAGETYSSSLDVYVTHNKMVYIYKNIYVKVFYLLSCGSCFSWLIFSNIFINIFS